MNNLNRTYQSQERYRSQTYASAEMKGFSEDNLTLVPCLRWKNCKMNF